MHVFFSNLIYNISLALGAPLSHVHQDCFRIRHSLLNGTLAAATAEGTKHTHEDSLVSDPASIVGVPSCCANSKQKSPPLQNGFPHLQSHSADCSANGIALHHHGPFQTASAKISNFCSKAMKPGFG